MWDKLVLTGGDIRTAAAKLLRSSASDLTCPLFSECQNQIGEFQCHCQRGLVLSEDGGCVANVAVPELQLLPNMQATQRLESKQGIIQNSEYTLNIVEMPLPTEDCEDYLQITDGSQSVTKLCGHKSFCRWNS